MGPSLDKEICMQMAVTCLGVTHYPAPMVIHIALSLQSWVMDLIPPTLSLLSRFEGCFFEEATLCATCFMSTCAHTQQ